MHNATEAALELQRAIKDLGMFSMFLCGQVRSQISFRRIFKRLSTVWIRVRRQ